MVCGMSQSLTERYGDRIAGVLSCYDRIVITGTVPVIWPEQTKRPDLTDKRTNLERAGAILQAGQGVAPF